LALPKKIKRFHRRMADDAQLQKGGRKADSNYYRRHLGRKKIAYISHLIKNTELLVIVCAVTFPEFKSGLIDRFLVLAGIEGVEPIVVLTKIDLMPKKQVKELGAPYEAIGLPVIYVCSEPGKEKGLDQVKAWLTGKYSAIVGHSGVGKTSMLNAIDPTYKQRVQEISEMTQRGRHTTTNIRLHEFAFGGRVYDMPGLKEIDFTSLTRRELRDYYPEFEEPRKTCRFSDCLHDSEEFCGVKTAAEAGEIDSERYLNYLQILHSLSDEI
jgi:ribosome biogenesis GTPase